MPTVVRIINDTEPHPGAQNMAVDQVLLESAVLDGSTTLRWYRWSEPTLSLGYFQKPNSIEIPDRLSELPVVRRLTGGGAIVHHRELTYSCAVPPQSPLSGNPGALYGLMHGAMIDVLRRQGVDAELRGDSDPDKEHEFLCFTRGDSNDVVLAGHKIIGSAQRRRRGAILQHGSMLCRVSEFAPELPGIFDLAQPAINESSLATEMTEEMRHSLGEQFSRTQLTDAERARAEEIERSLKLR